ncbi:MAG: methyltransferase domain-containing protein [Candidatus Pacebacteria bacterium]|nr:methyltransferase domain-containing protein [Candidatus Paceibacterota bacterium]
MESRKQKEIEYYDKQAENWLKENPNKIQGGDFEDFNPLILSSFQFLYKLLAKNCQDKIILDYGCGNGVHSVFPVKMGAEKVIGIDLSESSLKIARERAKQGGMADKTEFLAMDCEKMDFPDNYFDVIFDGGTFSSLDLNKAYPELFRVLKPEGILIGIETFGHNPFTNLKRKINKLIGKRTGWAAEHIFQTKDLKEAKKYFREIEVHYFHLKSWLAFPFLNLPGGKLLLKILETIEKPFLKIPLLNKYVFKVVFIFKNPKIKEIISF